MHIDFVTHLWGDGNCDGVRNGPTLSGLRPHQDFVARIKVDLSLTNFQPSTASRHEMGGDSDGRAPPLLRRAVPAPASPIARLANGSGHRATANTKELRALRFELGEAEQATQTVGATSGTSGAANSTGAAPARRQLLQAMALRFRLPSLPTPESPRSAGRLVHCTPLLQEVCAGETRREEPKRAGFFSTIIPSLAASLRAPQPASLAQ